MLMEENGYKALKIIGECALGLHRLNVCFHSKPGAISYRYVLPSTRIAHLMPSLSQLTSLKLSNVFSFEEGFQSHPAVITALSEPNGPYPNLQFVNFDGVSWTRTPSTAIPTREEETGGSRNNERSFPGFPWKRLAD
ncbi:hypothetical protein FRC09_008391 [Ceratobasidium sp. 395]|nr:hypothetical protein FRC09_008391 [Ceratobasidium sp. 395]